MTNTLELPLAFIRSHPESAASILEQIPIKICKQFIRKLPFDDRILLFNTLLPSIVGKLIQQYESKEQFDYLSKCKLQPMVRILRYLPTKVQDEVIRLFEPKKQQLISAYLQHKIETVGAWMQHDVLAISSAWNIEQTLSFIKRNQNIAEVNTPPLYVVDDENHTLLGEITPLLLVLASVNESILTLLKKPQFTLFPETHLYQAKAHKGWELVNTIPVVDKKNTLLGCLKATKLREGLHRITSSQTETIPNTPLKEVVATYSKTLAVALFKE